LVARPGLKPRSPSKGFKLCGSREPKATRTAILEANVTPASVALKQDGGPSEGL